MPQERPKQLDSPLLPKIFKYVGKAHVWVYRRAGGKVGGKWRVGAGFRKPVPTLLLEHRGRKSGKVFVTPLLYMFDGADVVIVASQGRTGRGSAVVPQPRGQPRHIRRDRLRPTRGARRDRPPGRARAVVAEACRGLRGFRQLPELDRPRDSRRGPETALRVLRVEAGV